MKKIIRPRQAGKSSELIRIAEETNAYIIVATRARAVCLADLAQKQGRNILFPVTWGEYERSRFKGSYVRRILIDDADAVLEQVFKEVTIDAITMTGQGSEREKMTLDEAIRHAEEVADDHDRIKQIKAVTLEECKCAEEHRQLAEWLKDYKRLKEKEPYKVSEYDKDHIWYKGDQYISLRRFLEVKNEKKNEPCGDAISRQAAIDKMKLVELDDGQSFYCISPEDVEALPPVTPQPKMGRWIAYEVRLPDRTILNYRCSVCGRKLIGYSTETLSKAPYCHCGARMESEG